MTLFAEGRPRLIVMDLTLPQPSGLEAVSRIRDLDEHYGSYTPIIGVLPHASIDDERSCLEHGMDEVLTKPIAPALLLEAISRWLGDETLRLSA